jgi:polynucleotide 5'-hydroxyl-kinase GRC3/NOL9
MSGLPHDLDTPSGWAGALEAVGHPGTFLLLGAVDSGKSTLAAVLADASLEQGRRVAVVDADVGQSSFGPPACVSMARVTTSIRSLQELTPDAMDFVGSPSPAGHLLQCATSTALLARAARAGGTETVIVDTTGLIAGPLARVLKAAKVRLLDADVLIALQSEDEVEHLLTPYARRSRPRVIRLPRSRRVKSRSRDERTARRQMKLGAYFAQAQPVAAVWDSLPMENTAWTAGEPVPGHVLAYAEERLACEVLHAERRADGLFLIVDGRPDPEGLRALGEGFGGAARACQKADLEHRLLALLDDRGQTLALGILENMDFRARRLTIFTPLADISQARGLRMGAIQVARDGTQLAWNDAGDLG